MKDRLIVGLILGLIAPLLVILLFWIFRFHYLSLGEFMHQALFLKVQFKIISLGVFFADLALFYLFMHFKKNKVSKGVIFAVMIYSLLFLLSTAL